MKLLTRLYTVYAAICFVITFLLLSPIFLICAQRTAWHNFALKTYWFWAKFYFPMIFMPVRIESEFKPVKGQQYLICANHFSFLDIPSLVQLPITSKFIGKSSIAAVPLFGYKFRKIHIAVDRASLKSRAESQRKAGEAIDQGFNLAFFPEGGIKSNHPPKMGPFRDGAFRLAVERQLPILPVLLPNNYKILPDDGKFNLRIHPLHIVIKAPIFPQSTDDKEAGRLRHEVHEVMQKELDKRSEI